MPYDQDGNLVDEYGTVIQYAGAPAIDLTGQTQPGYDPGFQPLPFGVEGVGTEIGAASPPVAAPGSGGPQEGNAVDWLLTHANASKQEGMDIASQIQDLIPELRGHVDEANLSSQATLDELNQLYDAQSPLGFYDQMGDLESQAAKAKADPRARSAQFSALDKLKGWTSPQVTAVERFLQEQARSAEERDQRSHRDAALRDMAARGVRSGGAEMTALLGGQAQTSQNRLLSDLGTQAGAVNRALQATGAYGDLATTLSDQTFREGYQTGAATDRVAEFNRTNSINYQRDKLAHETSERDKTVERGERKATANTKAADDKLRRESGLTQAQWDALMVKMGAAEKGNQGVGDAIGTKIGEQQTQKALDILNEGNSGRPTNALGMEEPKFKDDYLDKLSVGQNLKKLLGFPGLGY